MTGTAYIYRQLFYRLVLSPKSEARKVCDKPADRLISRSFTVQVDDIPEPIPLCNERWMEPIEPPRKRTGAAGLKRPQDVPPFRMGQDQSCGDQNGPIYVWITRC